MTPQYYIFSEALRAMLEAQWQVLLRQGLFGEITIRCVIIDGVLQGQSSVSSTRQIRMAKER